MNKSTRPNHHKGRTSRSSHPYEDPMNREYALIWRTAFPWLSTPQNQQALESPYASKASRFADLKHKRLRARKPKHTASNRTQEDWAGYREVAESRVSLPAVWFAKSRANRAALLSHVRGCVRSLEQLYSLTRERVSLLLPQLMLLFKKQQNLAILSLTLPIPFQIRISRRPRAVCGCQKDHLCRASSSSHPLRDWRPSPVPGS
jgi:hypothetical protein